MASSEDVYRSLVDMGIGPLVAREASVRFPNSTEAAVNWSFGEGSDVSSKLSNLDHPDGSDSPVDTLGSECPTSSSW